MNLPRRLVLASILISACSAPLAPPSSDTVIPAVPPSTTIPYPATIETPPRERPVYQGLSAETLPDGMTLVAMAASDTPIFASRRSMQHTDVLPAQTILGTPTVLRVVAGPVEGRAKVLLPTRPNGSTGWVDIEQMDLYVVEGMLVVDLSERTLTYYEEGKMVLEATVAIGTERNPTPTGSFFVTDSVTLADAGSPWGPHAFGLSARSDTITEYNGGDGIIGIHGTNRPGSIGQAASLGCVRVANEVISQLHELIPIGTPVEIVA